jgi:23S rRNA pseudouridine1911/1915/1917 synthase
LRTSGDPVRHGRGGVASSAPAAPAWNGDLQVIEREDPSRLTGGKAEPVSMTEQRNLPVPDGLEGERIDAALSRMFGLSRTRAAELIAAGDVLLDGVTPAKSERVRAGAWLQVRIPPPPTAPSPVPSPVPGMRILYEDEDIVVVDKPTGVAAHPTVGWTGPTVLGGLLAAGHRLATSGAAERQGIVHRLDANTTGVMVVAKSELAYSRLKRAFKERDVEKRYHALVQGHPDPLRGTIDAPIDRHPSGNGRFAVVAGGKPSITHYTTIEAFRAASLLEIDLETGRTHQIRVHMSALRHPCVGDTLYGADPTLAARLGLKRQWLHAVSLSFDHPITGHRVTFTSEYPEDLARSLEILRAES